MTVDLAGLTPRSFAFGDFVLIPERQTLLGGGVPIRLGCRALDLLTILVSRPGELISKKELLSKVWPHTVVEEGNLKVHLGALRRALGDECKTAGFIATVPGRGYRFVAPVRPGPLDGPQPEASPPRRTSNLPAGAASVIGRDELVGQLAREISECRLVTLAGAGGVGKTTVALATAGRMLDSFRDGVWLVDLAALPDNVAVPEAIAATLGLPRHPADASTALIEQLRPLNILLVLDSCERLIDSAACWAEQILASAPDVKILVTTREPLRIAGERVRRLQGLRVPSRHARLNATRARSFPAVQLFVDRAASTVDQFNLSDADAPLVGEICARLDGIPLAVEFAALRIETFGLEAILKQLDQRLRLLAGRRAGPARHRTLKALLDWSYALLTPEESAVLRCVSVFDAEFSAQGAGAVTALALPELAELLRALASKSLVAIHQSRAGPTYRLAETTRHYARDRLSETGEDAVVRVRHADYVRGQSPSAGEPAASDRVARVLTARRPGPFERREVSEDGGQAQLDVCASCATGADS